MVYVIVEVVVSPDSKIDGLRNRTGGRVIRQQVLISGDTTTCIIMYSIDPAIR
jgi:hypothetical protein